MNLTLSSGGGFTGLTQQHTIDIDTLDDKTRNAIVEYLETTSTIKPGNYNERWQLDKGTSKPIDINNMNEALVQLYLEMKKKLSYKR